MEVVVGLDFQVFDFTLLWLYFSNNPLLERTDFRLGKTNRLTCYYNYYFPVLKEDWLISTVSFGCVIYTTMLSFTP